MEKFLTSTQSPDWWISVVFVGVIVNLLSTLVNAFIQRKYSHLLNRWSEKNEKLAIIRCKRIKSLANSASDLFLASINLNRMRLDSIFDFLLALVLLGFGVATKDSHPIIYTIAVISSLFSLMQGFLATVKYGQEALLITEAKMMSDMTIEEFPRSD